MKSTFPPKKKYPAYVIVLNFIVKIGPVFNNCAMYRSYCFL